MGSMGAVAAPLPIAVIGGDFVRSMDMDAKILCAVITTVACWYAAPASAQCEALIKHGLFDHASAGTVGAFVIWAKGKRSVAERVDGSWNLGSEVLESIKLEPGAGAYAVPAFWHDVDQYPQLDKAGQQRLKQVSDAVAHVLDERFEACMRTSGLHVWTETTDQPGQFRVAARYASNGVPLLARIDAIKIVKGIHRASCHEAELTGTVGATTRRAVCERQGCDAVTLNVHASVNPLGGGTLHMPSLCDRRGAPDPSHASAPPG